MQKHCEEIEQKNIKLRKEIEEYNKNLLEQTKIYQAKEKELNFQNKMFAVARAQDKKQNEKELNELKLKKEQIEARINKAKSEKEKDALQKGIEILSNQEKYYLKEQELRQKSIDLLTRQKKVQMQQQEYKLKDLKDKVDQEMKNEAEDLIVKEMEINKRKMTNELVQEKLSEFKEINEKIKTEKENPELLAQKKNLELDLKILSTRDKIEETTEIRLANAKEANMKKIKEAEKKLVETSNKLTTLNKQITDEQNKSRKKLLLEQQKWLKEKLLAYQTEKNNYETDMALFENRQKYFNQEKQDLQESYATRIFTSENDRSQRYFKTKQDLIKAHENKEELEKKSKDLQDEYELNKMLKEAEDRKIDEAVKAGNESVARTATETKFASSVELSVKQSLVRWDEKKNKEAIEKQTNDIKEIEKTLEHIENKPVMTADTETTYKERIYEIEQKTLSDIEAYCQKYIGTTKGVDGRFNIPINDTTTKDKTTPNTKLDTTEFDSFVKDTIDTLNDYHKIF